MGIHASQLDLATYTNLGGTQSLIETDNNGNTRGLGLNWAVLNFRVVVSYSTTAALPAGTYANGTAGVGATITGNVNGAIGAVGGSGTALALSDTVLVKDQGTTAENGVYIVTQVGDGANPYILTRFDSLNTASHFNSGLVVAHKPTTDNATNQGSFWALQDTVATVGTDPAVFLQIGYSQAQVDALVNGLSWKQSVTAATAAALTANTAAGSGEGKTLTADANGALTVDGVAVTAGQRILVKDEATGSDNGIYLVTDAGSAGTPYILTRATDADTDAKLPTGSVVFVDQGTANQDLGFGLTTDGTITVDTTALTFQQVTARTGSEVRALSENFAAAAGVFGAGVTAFTLANAVSTDTAVSSGFVLLRNGVDDMTQAPNIGATVAATDWFAATTTLSIGTDVTGDGHDYRFRYWTAL